MDNDQDDDEPSQQDKIIAQIIDDAVEETLSEINPHDPETYGDMMHRLFGPLAGEIHSWVDLDTLEESPGGPLFVTTEPGRTWVLQCWLPGTSTTSPPIVTEWTEVSVEDVFSHSNRHRMFLPGVDGHEVVVELNTPRDWLGAFREMLATSALNGCLWRARQKEAEQDDDDDDGDVLAPA